MVPISYNVRSLLVRWPTTLATAGGIALVVWVLAAAMMLTNGIGNTLGASGSSDRALVIRKGSDAELASSIDEPTAKLVMEQTGVKRIDTAPVAAGEVLVVVTLEKPGTDGQVSNVQIRGVPESSFAVRPEVTIVEGRRARPGTDEVVIGRSIAGEFEGVALGGSFELKKNRPVTVVGVFEAGGSSLESEVWADIESVRSAFGRENLVSSVTVQLESGAAFDAFEAQVESDKRLGLEAMRESVYYEKQTEMTGMFIMGMGFTIAIFFSIGAMIGAMITMYGAVAQRRREIGTLRALGFSRFSILLSFMVEAVFLAGVGGALGIVLALPMSLVELSMMNFMTWSEVVFSFDLSPGVIITALIFGSVMGVFGGFFPAWSASKVSPIEAMRG